MQQRNNLSNFQYKYLFKNELKTFCFVAHDLSKVKYHRSIHS